MTLLYYPLGTIHGRSGSISGLGRALWTTLQPITRTAIPTILPNHSSVLQRTHYLSLPYSTYHNRSTWTVIHIPSSAANVPATSNTHPPRHTKYRASKRDRYRRNLIKDSLRRSIRLGSLDQIWVRFPRPKCRLLGGAPPGSTHQLIRRPSSYLPQLHSPDTIPELDDDEDWWPMYVLQASRLSTSDTEAPYVRESFDKCTFIDLPASHWQH